MKLTQVLLPLLLLIICSGAMGAGMAHDENFIVMAPDQTLADELIARANQFRREVAIEWLGRELPPSVGRTIINVELSDGIDRGFTWPIDSPARKCHKMWLTTSRERALGSTLRHEITHVVMATRFRGMMPPWAEEGAASLEDDSHRIETRQDVIAWYNETGAWPNLTNVLQADCILATDKALYSVAASVTEYLLACKDRKTFLAFAVAGKQSGWDRALAEHYGIGGVGQLQEAWQAWAGGTGRRARAVRAASTRKQIVGQEDGLARVAH
jgi:hypothetical protein